MRSTYLLFISVICVAGAFSADRHGNVWSASIVKLEPPDASAPTDSRP